MRASPLCGLFENKPLLDDRRRVEPWGRLPVMRLYELIHIKLREAAFFLDKLRAAPGASEEASFYLSAFLGAANAAGGRTAKLRPGFEKEFIKKVRTQTEQELWNFMSSERAWETHLASPEPNRRKQEAQTVTAGRVPVTAGGVSVTTPPCLCFVWKNDEVVPVVDMCTAYLPALRSMIEDYCALHGVV